MTNFEYQSRTIYHPLPTIEQMLKNKPWIMAPVMIRVAGHDSGVYNIKE